MRGGEIALYWDSSALLSLLLPDPRLAEAAAWRDRAVEHMLSTLTWAEVHATIARLHRQGALSGALADVAHDRLLRGPWERIHGAPDWQLVRILAPRWRLRGADLWHLALVKTLQAERPEIRLLAFDERLAEAGAGEGLAAPSLVQ